MQAKWTVLCQEMLSSGVKGAGYVQVTPRGLSSRYYAKKAFMLETPHEVGDREIYAYCALWRTTDVSLYQVGPLFMAPSYCTPEMGRHLLRQTLALLPSACRAFIMLGQGGDEYARCVAEEAVRRAREEVGFAKLVSLAGKPH